MSDQNIFEELRSEHDRHRELLDRVARTEGDSSERRLAFDELKRDVDAHAAAEERVFYSTLIGSATGRAKSAHSIEEHQEVRDLFQQLSEMELDNPHWIRRFGTLDHRLRHHMEEEEQQVFQLAGRVLNEREKRGMVSAFREAREEFLSRA